ncbi:AAA family ATPase [Proteiniclasticum ruminis]|uniref:5-methylcytosine-specific restriction enzyme B n=1 Tax=Proteiniclasticum ruminis TaxID=398199 RepID=A0A1I5DD62_9CLOT|nr:AAA family ATPase [Proteiniclasticum ruminis]SFN97133.1 5-methylcytosine-specific restriction enzyme B [Proteiniclasticum ruminis]
METKQYDWVDLYKEFSHLLLGFRRQREELITKVEKIFKDTGISMPTLDKDNQITDIDPFTIFGLFNKSSMKESNRLKIIESVAETFGVQADIPTSFDSVPVLNNQNATFYDYVGERGESDIEELWDLFETAMKYADNPTEGNRKVLSKYFDLVINKKGNGNSKVTMALYWIAPDSFLNLDQRNSWYIYESGKIPGKVVSSLPKIESKIPSAKYFEIINILLSYLNSGECSLKDFKELSFEAWRYSEEVNQKIKDDKTTRDEKGAGLADEDVDTVHYWIYSPGDGAVKWEDFYRQNVMGIGWSRIGDLTQYTSKDEMKVAMKEKIDPSKPYRNAAHATWQFANEMKPGDIVFVKKGMHQLIGRGIVKSDYFFDSSIDSDYSNFREMNWTDNYIDEPKDHPGQAVMKTLTDITSYTDYVEKLITLFEKDEDNDEVEVPDISYPLYDKKRFLDEVYMDEDKYNTLVGLVKTKKNVILQGAPGVGKTYAAKRLAYSMMGVKDQERVMMIQFHQSYSYEDFIEGFRPTSAGEGFEIKKGSFYNFCKKAADDLDNDYFFIIDEINRGNLSKIFGELFMLIENDKRGNALQLLYSDEKFSVPKNLHIIGMMNTADRSLAMLDYALRRRFAFFEMKPGFESEGFRNYRMSLNSKEFNNLINTIDNLNGVITADESLGEGFCIGHSYFCELREISNSMLSNIVEYELIPLLKEYWFDEPLKIKDWTNYLRGAIK